MLPKRATRVHAYGRLIATVSQVGDNGPFSIDFDPPKGGGFDKTFATFEEAKREADFRVAAYGHDCDETCSGWRESN